MSLPHEKKTELIGKFRVHGTDTGSPEVQIALLSARIEQLSHHFKGHEKDHASRRGLLQMVGRRRKLLNYLRVKDQGRYQRVLGELGIRK